MLSVRESQVRWAQQVLEQAGVPLENPVPTQRRKDSRARARGGRTTVRSQGRSSPEDDLGGIVDSVRDVLDTRLF